MSIDYIARAVGTIHAHQIKEEQQPVSERAAQRVFGAGRSSDSFDGGDEDGGASSLM
jgi:hypothetical protein